MFDPELVQAGGERLQEGFQLMRGDPRCCDGAERKGFMGEKVDGHGAGVDDRGKRGVVDFDRLVVLVCGYALARKGQVGARDGNVEVGFRGQGPHDSVGAASAAGERPVQIGILDPAGAARDSGFIGYFSF